ncbi:hydrolase Nlp/P60 [Chitinophaga caeni]|uniref:Hydrolase Nlp/P60 n=1 Tax=Chitinophaga caeni TaxID=2029983 RepID=A0A291QWW4_9BACT|nr:C40 family peptidase [Chitinophaga caeni]ATL48519.1 hydrolase Nlp/P60 [Chitinophaga caeni]
MPYAITIVPVMPVRAEPSHRSEIVTQVLFGECVVTDTEQPDGWVKISTQFDNYAGWVTLSHLGMVAAAIYDAPYTHFAKEWVNQITVNGQKMHIPYGCIFKQIHGQESTWGDFTINWEDSLQKLPHAISTSGPTPKIQVADAQFKSIAKLFLNTAYLWGGKSVFGIDCSGFSQSVYKVLGMPLLRDAYQQAGQGESVGFLAEAKLGDLAFFDNAEGKITHVGIMLNDHEIIHAAGKVRIDAIDTEGIINVDTGLRTHKLRIIKRLRGI